MEDVLAVYTRPYDPLRPQVCLDETSRQLLAEVTPPLPPAPGQPAREDYEYVREGVCNVFLVCEPLAGWRQVMVSARRTNEAREQFTKALEISPNLQGARDGLKLLQGQGQSTGVTPMRGR